jgi:hypothetical protein
MRVWSLLVGGILLVASAGAHAFAGWPPLRALLVQAENDPELVAGLTVGWYFGSVAMLAFGVVVLRDAWMLKHDLAHATGAAAIIGAAYLLFGLRALFYRGFNPHFLGFILIGLVILIPALPGGKARRP